MIFQEYNPPKILFVYQQQHALQLYLVCQTIQKSYPILRSMVGGELSFFTPRYSFPTRKKTWFFWDTTQNTEMSQKKNKLRFVARPKFANVALSSSQDGATYTQPIQRVHDCSASRQNRYKCLCPDFPFRAGKTGMKQFGSKSQSGQEIK